MRLNYLLSDEAGGIGDEGICKLEFLHGMPLRVRKVWEAKIGM